MANLNNQELLAKLQASFGDKILNQEDTYGMLSIEVDRSELLGFVSWLKEDDSLRFRFLTDLCGVHFPENKGRELGVVCHLHSLENNIRLRVKSFFSIEDPTCPTLTELFSGANWMERETFDFYGIQFTGHPDLRRILNMDSMDYHPLRKEYALEDETRTDKSDKFFGR
jgi:NADH-quinone oxidoreductase subunit C